MITRSQPYRLDFHPTRDLPGDEDQLGTVIESADVMFEMLFADLLRVEGSIATSIATAATTGRIGRYQLLTNGYAPAPELVFSLGDVIEVWNPNAA